MDMFSEFKQGRYPCLPKLWDNHSLAKERKCNPNSVVPTYMLLKV
jgi:hypothetical protein